ncbi:AAA family ATPase [Photobacterium sp. CAU 1568]|uniref:AAA family ATPase n=1 Tax=Photobacterium arenosum TaxID=2774143 RepID=A0ABR9BKZ0_9GAMM|nr:AAA family ATPase [Photobacterium arenosum]MBD8513210.1 AAA family ATPase [Photobacterium arenosum]
MTIAASLTSLDLDSQIQLLSRVQFLTRFSSHLIQISGEPGAGKSWLAQRYLEQWADSDGINNTRQALLMCHPAQNDNQHRTILLNQLIPGAVFNESDPLHQSVERLLAGKPVELLLVIDDAHMLSPALIGELWALVVKAQDSADWQVNVLLFSQTGRLTKALHQVSHGQGQTPLELEIPLLSEQEVQAFLELVLATHSLDANQRRALKAQAEDVAPTPGALSALNHTEVVNMANTSSRAFSPAALLLLLLVIAAAGLVFWYFPDQTASSQSDTESPSPDMTAADEVLAQSADGLAVLPDEHDELPLATDSGAAGLTDSSDSQIAEAGSSAPAEANAEILPEPVKIEGLTVGRSNTAGQRVVVPSDVVDAMLTEQETGGSGELAVAAQGALSQAANTPAAEGGETGIPAAASTPEPTADAAPTAPQLTGLQAAMAEDKDTLKSVNSRHYALQLAAMHSLDATRSFLNEYGIEDTAQVYQTQRQGVRWYIVVTGDYSSVAAARRAQAQLPAKVQSVQPWVKSYTQIHREIDRVQ